jgi:hypothetical protein
MAALNDITIERIVALLSCIARDCESGDAPLNDTWWATGKEFPSGVHVTIYEEALDILERMKAELLNGGPK